MRLVPFVASMAVLAGPIVSASPADVEVSLDLAKTRAPISKYVYGQFIEHLGRCIYGGLWAEMLEDRKFYYPVDGQAPAWEMQFPRPISLGRRRPSLRAARAVAVDDRRRQEGRDHGPRAAVHRRAHAGRSPPTQHGQRARPGAPRPRAGPALRGPRRARRRGRGRPRSTSRWPGAPARRTARAVAVERLTAGVRDDARSPSPPRARPTTAAWRSWATARAASASAPSP